MGLIRSRDCARGAQNSLDARRAEKPRRGPAARLADCALLRARAWSLRCQQSSPERVTRSLSSAACSATVRHGWERAERCPEQRLVWGGITEVGRECSRPAAGCFRTSEAASEQVQY